MRIHLVVNISRVKPYHDRLPGQPVSAPGPSSVMEDRKEEYKVDFIMDSWYKGKRLEYLVHWKSWADMDCTWELLGNLANAADAVAAFHATHPSAPRHLHSISPFDFLQLFCYVGSSLLSLRLHHLIAWKSILSGGAVLHTLRPTLCPHGILFPFSLCATLCHFSPNHLHHAVQARLCHKQCRHIIGLGPYCLSMTSYPTP